MGGELSINSLLSNGSVVLSRNKKNRLKFATLIGASSEVLREFLSRRFLVFPSELYPQQAAGY